MFFTPIFTAILGTYVVILPFFIGCILSRFRRVKDF